MIGHHLRAAWAYRQFILTSIRNELVNSFARSRLGGAWMIIQPLVTVAIYAVILSAVIRGKLPGLEHSRFAYAIYLISGIACWSLFSEVITRSLTLFIDNGHLLKKIVFPKVCLPLIVAGTALVNNAFLLLAVLAIYLVLGHELQMPAFLLPGLMLLTLALSTGIGVLVGTLNVFIRDLGQIVPLVLQVMFWFTPIVYPVSILPDAAKALLPLNPMYSLVESYHAVLAYGTAPPWPMLGLLSALVPLLLLGGFWLVRRASPDMADVL